MAELAFFVKVLSQKSFKGVSMKTLLALMIMIPLASAFAEEKQEAKQKEMMEKMKEFGTPGTEHKVLSDTAGSWKYTSKWWKSADAKPEESTGTAKFRMILGGRFLEQEVKGKSMGQPFEGMGLVGYDKLKKTYDTYWFDTMGTGAAHASGTYDAQTHTINDKGEFSCPMEADKTAEYRSEWVMKDNSHMTYSMYGKGMGTAGGREFKMMEMIYTRTK
jgi:hypothetical protein